MSEWSDRVGKDWQVARPWPTDPETLCFITRRGATCHYTSECPKYQHAIANTIKLGRTVHERIVTSTGEAKAKKKGICSYCFGAAGIELS